MPRDGSILISVTRGKVCCCHLGCLPEELSSQVHEASESTNSEDQAKWVSLGIVTSYVHV